MKKTAIILSGIIAASAALPNFASSPVSPSSFKDTQNHWSKDYVERLYKEGYVKGNGGNFYPNQALKTEDFLIMVVKVVKPEFKDLTAAEGQSYYKPYLEKALEIGLIKDAQYDEVPQYEGRPMPRELAVQVVDRALTLMGEQAEADHGLEYKFDDYKIINSANQNAVLKAYQLGIIKGSDGKFEPKNPLSRAESAVLITKLMDKSMRDTVIVSKNTKDYGETVNYFLKAFLAQVKSKTVVIEKDKNGLKNTGDVWYSEKPIVMKGKLTNWWTDQEFEDLTTGKSANNGGRHNNSIGLGVSDLSVKEWLGLEEVGGNFIPYNGEMMFINVDGVHDGKAHRYYEMPQKNLNRLAYDLAKYSTQYAETNGYYAQMFTIKDSHMYFGVSADYDHYGTSIADICLYPNPKKTQKLAEISLAPQVGFSVESGEKLNRNSDYVLQTFKRVYGDKDGEVIFKMFKDYCQGKHRYSESKTVYKTYNGIKLCFIDGQAVDPCLYSTFK
jgi:hypothetical protein